MDRGGRLMAEKIIIDEKPDYNPSTQIIKEVSRTETDKCIYIEYEVVNIVPTTSDIYTALKILGGSE